MNKQKPFIIDRYTEADFKDPPISHVLLKVLIAEAIIAILLVVSYLEWLR